MQLLSEHELVKTGPNDKASLWVYSPVLGPLQRKRFQLVLQLLGEQRFGRLLEIGYGSGVFFPELARHCERLYGADIHTSGGKVIELLKKRNLVAGLVRASMAELPFAGGSMDCIVAISCLEYCQDQEALGREIRRMLAPGGCLILVTPGCSRVIDFGLSVLTGTDAREEYGLRRESLIGNLEKYLAVKRRLNFPGLVGFGGQLYRALRLEAR